MRQRPQWQHWQDPADDATPPTGQDDFPPPSHGSWPAPPMAARPPQWYPSDDGSSSGYNGTYPPPPEYYQNFERPPVVAPPQPLPSERGAQRPRRPTRRDGPLQWILPLGSALLSFALYSVLGGWQFGLGLVLLLLLHEMGHFVAMRAKGLPASLPIFIPFLGAFVSMRRLPNNVRDEAEIALAGPLAGGLGGAVCVLLAHQVANGLAHLFLLLAYLSFTFNLLNLIPVLPLDGGRIVGAITRWLWPVGFVLVLIGFFLTWSPLLLLLGGLWIAQMVGGFRLDDASRAYYRVGIAVRVYMGVLYFGLAAGLALGVALTERLVTLGVFLR